MRRHKHRPIIRLLRGVIAPHTRSSWLLISLVVAVLELLAVHGASNCVSMDQKQSMNNELGAWAAVSNGVCVCA